MSVVRATMWRAIRSELVQRAGVAVKYLGALGFRQRRLERKARIIKVPMRIIRREQQAVDADPFDQRSQMSGFIRLVDRLCREPEMLLHIFRRTPLQMRDLVAESVKMLVHPPGGRGNPAQSALDEHDLQARKTLGYAFDDEAGQLRRHRMRVRLMLLDIIGRPAAAGRRVAAIAADMDAERQIKLLGASKNRPVAAAAERLVGARTDVDLHILADFRATIDLGDGRLGVVLPHQNRGFNRGSRLVQCASCQSLTARWIAAPNSRFCCEKMNMSSTCRMPNSISSGSRCCLRMKARSDPGGPPVGGQASRRAINGEDRG